MAIANTPLDNESEVVAAYNRRLRGRFLEPQVKIGKSLVNGRAEGPALGWFKGDLAGGESTQTTIVEAKDELTKNNLKTGLGDVLLERHTIAQEKGIHPATVEAHLVFDGWDVPMQTIRNLPPIGQAIVTGLKALDVTCAVRKGDQIIYLTD